MPEMPSVSEHLREQAWRKLKKSDQTHEAGKKNPARDAASESINYHDPVGLVERRRKRLGH